MYPRFVIKYHKVKLLKFNFLFVVLQMTKNEQVTEVYNKMGSHPHLTEARWTDGSDCVNTVVAEYRLYTSHTPLTSMHS